MRHGTGQRVQALGALGLRSAHSSWTNNPNHASSREQPLGLTHGHSLHTRVLTGASVVCCRLQIDVLARIDSPAAQPSSAQGDRNLAPIVAPAVVVGSLLLAGLAAGLLIMRRRRRARTKRSRQSLLPVDTKHGFGSGGSDGLEPLQGPPGPRPLASPVNPTPLTLPGAYRCAGLCVCVCC